MIERKTFKEFLVERKLREAAEAIKVAANPQARTANRAAGEAVGKALQQSSIDLAKADARQRNRFVGKAMGHAVAAGGNVSANDVSMKINPKDVE